MSIKLHIPNTFEEVEAPCCQRARTIRRCSHTLNLINLGFCAGSILSDLLLHKTLPDWFVLFVWVPIPIIMIFTSLFSHWLAVRLPFIPETPPPSEEK